MVVGRWVGIRYRNVSAGGSETEAGDFGDSVPGKPLGPEVAVEHPTAVRFDGERGRGLLWATGVKGGVMIRLLSSGVVACWLGIGTAWSGEVEVVRAEAARQADGSWHFAVALRHADAGYEEAIECAKENGLDLPMI